MTIAGLKLKWIEFRQKSFNWRSKRSSVQLVKVNLVRERSIRLLQSRYGYTREKATFELNNYYPKARLY